MIEKNKQKVILISGFTGYLGSEFSRKLSKDGFLIAGLYNKVTEPFVKDTLVSLHGNSHGAYSCNLENPKDISKTIEDIEEKQGKLYALVHCAWIKSERKQLNNCTPEEVLEEFNGNVLNSFNLISACAKIFKEQKEGVIIGITTAGVVIPEAAKNLGVYILGKTALQGMLSTFKTELSPAVKVYSIAPGFMAGGINKDIPNAFVEMIKQKSLNQNITNPNEIAETISSICLGKIEQEDMTILIAPEYNKK
jgi:NAD(P)-dependent dehydrogenase (short-subunit alcohol dehydrogenase family)